MSARAKRGIAVIAAAGVICVGAAYVASMVGALVADEPDPYALTRDDLRDLEALSSSTLEPFGSVEAVSEYVEAVRQLRRRREVHYEVPEWLEANDEVSEADDAEGGSGERYGIMGPAENAGAIGVLRAMAGSWNSPISPYGSVTNVQVGGIDEGDIVKTHGHHLVVLRRGRIFTVELENDELRVLDMIDVPPPGVTDGWYDEMLISGDTVLVLSYSYEASASELSLFTIDAQGRLARGPVHYLRSGDYYSSRNYATRLIGQRLIVYTPIDLTTDPDAWVPSVRIASSDRWRPIIDFREVYRPVQPALEPTLHTVIDCDLSGVQIACTARGIAGPWDRTFYVAHDAVYLWIAEPQGSTHARGASYAGPTAVVYRLPLDGSSVGAARVFGAPFDQLCLHRDRGGALNVLVSADGRGDGMWASRAATGSVSLARIPEAALRSGLTEANRAWYMILPELDDAELHARFVGEHVLYGAGESFGDERVASTPVVHVYPYRGGYLTSLALAHDVERIEVMGDAAVVIGAARDALHFSSVTLGETPAVAAHQELDDLEQAESRGHGFFFRQTGRRTGLLGLPVRDRDRDAVSFLRVANYRFTPLGLLSARDTGVNDACRVSCADWYGDARPLFLGDRILALLGYELVEGDLSGETLTEQRRIHLYRDRPAPPTPELSATGTSEIPASVDGGVPFVP